MGIDGSAVSIPRKRPTPAGVGHRNPPPPKRSRLELAATGALQAAPERTRPLPTHRPPSPVRAPDGAQTPHRPLLPTRHFPSASSSLGAPPAPYNMGSQRPLQAAKSRRTPFTKPVTMPAKPTKPTKPAAKGLNATAKENATTYQGEDAQVSERENLASLYTKRLIDGLSDKTIDGKPGPDGIMSPTNAMGEPNKPYGHQRIAVKRMANKHQHFTVLGHDMGLGKTATALQLVAAELCVLKRVPFTIISVPSATLDQWEDSVADWLTIPRSKVLVTSKEAEMAKKLPGKQIVIVSRDCLALAFSKCHSKQEVQRETARGLRKGVEWLRKPGTSLHPVFAKPVDVFVVDEAHYMRNPNSRRCEAHYHLSAKAGKRVLLSGTFVVNSPTDLAGICKAGNAPRDKAFEGKIYDLQDVNTWVTQRCHKTINRAAVALFQREYLDRATDKILQLPPLEQQAVNYDVKLSGEVAHAYNDVLGKARALKVRIERMQAGRATAKDLTQLMALLQLLQQYAVSPLLAECGAAAFKDKVHGSALLERASRQPSASFYALRAELETLRAAGHKRIVVAANHTTIMDVLKMWLERAHPEFGACFAYKGDMSQKERLAAKRGFLRSQRTVLLLSIGAGGVGLHLVPGCEAMVFWGSMPFSPAHTRQAMKRIHRIGQAAPITGRVSIIHMIPYGSVDGAIATVHGDKNALIQLVQEGDDSAFGGDTDSQWRKTGRIVDACEPVGEDGSFGPMPMHKKDGNGDPIPNTTYTLLPGVVTRGREPAPGELDAEAAAARSRPSQADMLNKMLAEAGVPLTGSEMAASLANRLANLQAAGIAM